MQQEEALRQLKSEIPHLFPHVIPAVEKNVRHIIQNVPLDYLVLITALGRKKDVALIFENPNIKGKKLVIYVRETAFCIDSLEFSLPYTVIDGDTIEQILTTLKGLDTYTAIDRIRECEDLRDGWDGYGAKALLPGVKETCFMFLHKLSGDLVFNPMNISPTNEGTVSMNFYGENEAISVTIGENNRIIPSSGPEFDIHDDLKLKELKEKLLRLC